MSKEDGIYADPEDETSFYMCEGEKATKKFCPTGLKFNPVISSCDVAEDVKYVGNNADSPGTFNSLPGNDGLKVLSVGDREEPGKDGGKAVFNAPPPPKLFSINIFNGAHSQATNKRPEGIENNTANNERFQGNGQNDGHNNSTIETSLPKDTTKKLASDSAVVESNVHDDMRNVPEEKMGENPSSFLAEKIASADKNSLNHAADQLKVNHSGEKTLTSQDSSTLTAAELISKHPIRPAASFSLSSRLPESSVTSDNRKLQADQQDRNTNSLEGQLGTSPHKIFAINIYGSHPHAPNIENQIHTADGNRLSGEQSFELLDQYRDTSSRNNGHKVPVEPLGFQGGKGNVLNTPGLKSGSEYEQGNPPNADLGSNTVEENLFATNDTSATPLHFKLKINMDNSGKQPVINCTLSECSENDFAIGGVNMKGKGSQSQKNESTAIGSTEAQQNVVDHHDNYGSQDTKEDGDVHVTFKTDSSEPITQLQGMKGLRLSPNLLTGSSHEQTVKNPSQLEDTSQTLVHSSNISIFKEAHEDVFSRHSNGTTLQATHESGEENRIKTQENADVMQHGELQNGTKIATNLQTTYESREENKGKTQEDIADMIKGGNVIQHGEHDNGTKMATNLQATYGNREENKGNIREDNTSMIKGGNVIQHGERDNEVKMTNLQESSAGVSDINNGFTDPKLKWENENQIPSNDNNFFNTKLQTTSQENGLTNQLENSNIKNQFHEQGELNRQDFVQIQRRPQLKIILKTPGKFVNPLKRHSDARGRHIVQILKSLIDRPLKLGSKNKEVASMLSKIVKKPVQGRIRGKISQDNSEDIKDSGSIAQSILEANKEYLDAVAMQGMVFSDGDPDTENMTNIADSFSQVNGYQQQESELPQWTKPNAQEKDASTKTHKESPEISGYQGDWLNDEHLITRISKEADGGEGK